MRTDTEAVPAGTWAVDKTHSNVGFAVEYMAGTFSGTFSDFDAVVADGALKGSAKVASIQVKDPNLEAHLQGPEFFDAATYPAITFVSTSFTKSSDTAYVVTGNLTMRGVTKPVTFAVTTWARIPGPQAAASTTRHDFSPRRSGVG